MNNDQMKPNRYLRWHKARVLVSRIQSHLNAGGKVMIGTATRHTTYDKRHVDMFRATRTGAFAQRGKNWECIDFCGIRFSNMGA